MRRTAFSLLLVFAVALTLFIVTPTRTITTRAQEQGAPARGPRIAPTASVTFPDPVERTQEDVERDEASGQRAPAPPAGVAINRPTMSYSDYAAAKAAAARAPVSSRPGSAAAPLAPPVSISPTIEGTNETEAGGGAPPDTHGAAGQGLFVTVTNQHVDIYAKVGGARVNGCSTGPCLGVSLASFFGYTTEALFDPRVIWDNHWGRWVITAEAFQESSTVQYYFMAFSKTIDARGAYWIYQINVTFFAGDFWDFPQLGADQDSVIVTANIFNSGGSYTGADMFAVAKARVYRGRSFSIPVYVGLPGGTLAPPYVIDQNYKTFLISAPPSGSALNLYTLTNSSRPNGEVLTGPVAVTVGAYGVPPTAPQPVCGGGANALDTGDSRFANNSTQIGNSLWQIHSIAAGPAALNFYEINTSTNSVIQDATFFTSGTSSDFNGSIVANDSNDAFVTWSSTDTSTNAQVRFSGRLSTDAVNTINSPGTALVTSSTCLSGNFDPNFGHQRWGDYSAVTVDINPSVVGEKQAWIYNEKINAASVWGSKIGHIKL